MVSYGCEAGGFSKAFVDIWGLIDDAYATGGVEWYPRPDVMACALATPLRTAGQRGSMLPMNETEYEQCAC